MTAATPAITKYRTAQSRSSRAVLHGYGPAQALAAECDNLGHEPVIWRLWVGGTLHERIYCTHCCMTFPLEPAA